MQPRGRPLGAAVLTSASPAAGAVQPSHVSGWSTGVCVCVFAYVLLRTERT